MSILDVGCGLGIDTLAMAKALGKSQHGGRVVGVDMNTAMMNYAKGAAGEASIPANVKLEYHQVRELLNLAALRDPLRLI